MWSIALQAFLSSPIVGVGSEGLLEIKRQAVIDGGANTSITNYSHQHNDIFNELTHNGLVGAIALVFLYVTYGFVFIKQRQKRPLSEFPVLGLVTVVLIIGCGFTDTILVSARGIMLFFMTMTFFFTVSTGAEDF